MHEDANLVEECERLQSLALSMPGVPLLDGARVPGEAQFVYVEEGLLAFAGQLTSESSKRWNEISMQPGQTPLLFAKSLREEAENVAAIIVHTEAQLVKRFMDGLPLGQIRDKPENYRHSVEQPLQSLEEVAKVANTCHQCIMIDKLQSQLVEPPVPNRRGSPAKIPPRGGGEERLLYCKLHGRNSTYNTPDCSRHTKPVKNNATTFTRQVAVTYAPPPSSPTRDGYNAQAQGLRTLVQSLHGLFVSQQDTKSQPPSLAQK